MPARLLAVGLGLEFDLGRLFARSEGGRRGDEEGDRLLVGCVGLILEDGTEAAGVIGGGHGFDALLG